MRSTPPERRTRLLWAVYATQYDRIWDQALTHLVATSVADLVAPDLACLEVGAGTGLITRSLEAVVGRVDACEPHPGMRRRFERRMGRSARPERLADLQPQGPCTVVAVNVVHLTEDPDRSVRHLVGVAGAGGQVVLGTPAPGTGLRDLVRALRSAGVGRARRTEIVARHLVLAPLAGLARAGLAQRPDLDRGRFVVAERVHGVIDIVVVPGEDPDPTGRGPDVGSCGGP